MTQYRTFDRMMVLEGPYGSADWEKLKDLGADRLDQNILDHDTRRQIQFQDGASQYITLANMQTRVTRDLMLDIKNPRQELPKDPTAKLIDTIPNLNPQQPDMSHPADYEFSTTAALYNTAQRNHRREDNMFVSKKRGGGGGGGGGPSGQEQKGGKQLTADSGLAKPQEAMDQLEIFEGGAAARTTNFIQMEPLAKDQDDAYLNSVESQSAF